jgi:hypothetical protein
MLSYYLYSLFEGFFNAAGMPAEWGLDLWGMARMVCPALKKPRLRRNRWFVEEKFLRLCKNKKIHTDSVAPLFTFSLFHELSGDSLDMSITFHIRFE